MRSVNEAGSEYRITNSSLPAFSSDFLFQRYLPGNIRPFLAAVNPSVERTVLIKGLSRHMRVHITGTDENILLHPIPQSVQHAGDVALLIRAEIDNSIKSRQTKIRQLLRIMPVCMVLLNCAASREIQTAIPPVQQTDFVFFISLLDECPPAKVGPANHQNIHTKHLPIRFLLMLLYPDRAMLFNCK